MSVDLTEAKRIIDEYRGKSGILIPMLQSIQGAYGYVPEETVYLISDELEIYPSEVYGVLTFYTQFHLTPRGRHIIRVCQGTACHVMGGKELLDYMAEKLQVEVGSTTEDGEFSLERVACLGCCGMAPVITVDQDFHGRVTVNNVDDILKQYREEA
jgi:NADH-quinone oxidoreductase subunit E